MNSLRIAQSRLEAGRSRAHSHLPKIEEFVRKLICLCFDKVGVDGRLSEGYSSP